MKEVPARATVTVPCNRKVPSSSDSPEESGGVAAAFARRHGFALVQVELRQELTRAADREATDRGPTDLARTVRERDDLARSDRERDDLARSGPEVGSPPGREHSAYRIETVWDTLPEGWLEARRCSLAGSALTRPWATLSSGRRSGTPIGFASDGPGEGQGRRAVESVARHLESGRLVGYTDLLISEATPHLAYQADTLVLREHRGHGLGQALKEAILAAGQRDQSQVHTVRTWNARSNEPMLRINARMGFVVTGYSHEWQKGLG